MWFRVVLGAAAGLLIGALIGSILRSRGGTCPLTCHPVGAAIVGAIVGALVASSHIGGGRFASEGGGGAPAVADAAEFDELLASGRPVLADFHQPGCPPCTRLEPTIASLAEAYEGRAAVVRVNVRQVPSLAQRYGIRGTPTVVLFAGGQVVDRWLGVKSEREYRAAIESALPAGAEPGPPEQTRKEDNMPERNEAVTFKGNPLTLQGKAPSVGEQVPDFTVLANDLSEVALSSLRGSPVVLLTVPSLDTSVCDREVRRFNEEATKMNADVKVLAISMDLPFAQARWCGAADVERVQALSDHRDAAAGEALGVLIKELRLLARAVFVLDGEGKVVYREIVPEMTDEPDYSGALAAIAELTSA